VINRARFAPSPTGFLHIGNARSAILNWSYINKKGGEFILRIDDTDISRSKKEFESKIKEDLLWLGLDWSKTFNQSDRLKVYQDRIKILKDNNRLYPCFESEEELSLKRKTLLSLGKPPIYDRSSLKLDKSKINQLIESGKKHHWRFRLDDEKISWNDLIKGTVVLDSKNLSDPILIREDGSLLYHLPSVIDDIEENITDIIRGEDHITNTAFHIQIFKALNSNVPNFGHHPFLLDENGKSLGKRLNSLSLQKLIESGFESITILNYLSSIGTSNNLSKFKDYNELLKNFNIKQLSTSSPKFSLDVLKQLNKEILQTYDFKDVSEKFIHLGYKNLNEKFWLFINRNINFFSESLDWYNIIYNDEIYKNENNNFLNAIAELLPNEPYDDSSWEKWTKLIKENTGKKGKDLFMPIRMALTGKKEGPELKYLMPLLTKEHIQKKLGYIK
tara:strand:+ start:3347 stop:4684 length:1338 start_codon:yes stop_codon:yes gene_type:complete